MLPCGVTQLSEVYAAVMYQKYQKYTAGSATGVLVSPRAPSFSRTTGGVTVLSSCLQAVTPPLPGHLSCPAAAAQPPNHTITYLTHPYIYNWSVRSDARSRVVQSRKLFSRAARTPTLAIAHHVRNSQ